MINMSYHASSPLESLSWLPWAHLPGIHIKNNYNHRMPGTTETQRATRQFLGVQLTGADNQIQWQIYIKHIISYLQCLFNIDVCGFIAKNSGFY